MSIEDSLRRRILEKYTISGFAEMIDVPYSTLQSILRNVQGASIANLRKIARGLNLPLDAFAGDNLDELPDITYSPILMRAQKELSPEDLKKIEQITEIYLKERSEKE